MFTRSGPAIGGASGIQLVIELRPRKAGVLEDGIKRVPCLKT